MSRAISLQVAEGIEEAVLHRLPRRNLVTVDRVLFRPGEDRVTSMLCRLPSPI